ncbi:hypothetical protein IFM89_001091 [Coptis chinensis]|uniref:Auxin-responsive protein n=1 Tax=Coptis chinensis TaxID=261450 RepID=A0A835HHY5_9MAGN|nr:hypothetical protein IFM89_001091 [Coptis chinensis]
MSTLEEKSKAVGGVVVNGGAPILAEEMKILKELQDQSGTRKSINSELWHACAGPLVSLPQVGSLVYYFPQGHSEQVAVSTKRIAASHIPNYPNLPSQLMCQVHNVTLHAEKDTDEIYAQMTLQPVNSENDVFPVPDFGVKQSKHPKEFFCKTLTASDTSTHGGFSVPRRAAEKLFPQLVRDEKSQLLMCVRRANHLQIALPSSVLSADSMHFGVLAAAAHAAANRSPFTIFYNPRACPAEFVVPLTKFQKSVYGTQVSIGMRFGMMFETEESGKRRYMGTIVGITDLDPLRWPNSKWHNLQVEWDESGGGGKQNRVSLWEIETPESLFTFPSLTAGFKRPLHTVFAGPESEWENLIRRPFIPNTEYRNGCIPYPPMSSLGSEQLMKMLCGTPSAIKSGSSSYALPACIIKGNTIQAEVKLGQAMQQHIPQMSSTQSTLIKCQGPSPQHWVDSSNTLDPNTKSKAPTPEQFHPQTKVEKLPAKTGYTKAGMPPIVTSDRFSPSSSGKCNEDKLVSNILNPQDLVSEPVCPDQGLLQLQKEQQFAQPLLETSTISPHHIDAPQFGTSSQNGLFPYPNQFPSQYLDADDWLVQPSTCHSLPGMLKSPGHISGCCIQDISIDYPDFVNQTMPTFGQELVGPEMNYLGFFCPAEELTQLPRQDLSTIHSATNSSGLRDLSEDSKEHSEIYDGLPFGSTKAQGTIIDPSVSSTLLDRFGSLGNASFKNQEFFVGNFSSSQDVQSQITTASLADSHGFSLQEFQDNSGGTSSSNVDFDESSLFQQGAPWKQVSPPLRTYTKVQKTGSVGRSIDVTRYNSYEELRSAIACMFGLEGLLDDPRGSEWKLVYVDYENDVLLVGDDPWEEFVTCVRCIRILSPSEVQQMSDDGLLQ